MRKKKKTNLASGEPDITTSYVGRNATGYIHSVLYASNTLSENLIKVHENVTKSLKLQVLDVNNLLQDGSCDFTHQGGVTQNERSLDVDDFKVNLELCKSEWFQGWEGEDMGPSRNGVGLPRELFNSLTDEIGGNVAEALDLNIWIGQSTVVGAPTKMKGFIAILEDEGTATHVNGDTTDATPSNVVAKIRAVINAVNPKVRNKADFTIYVAPNIAHVYGQYLGDEGWMNRFQEGGKPANVDGYNLVVVHSLPDNFIVAGQQSNFHFGTMLKADTNKVSVLDMEPNDGSDNMRFIMKFKAGVQIGVVNQVWWTDNKGGTPSV